MANNQTLIKLKRYAGTNISDAVVEYGEPFFDKNNGFLYIGTEKGGKSLSAMREAGEYFKWINSKNPVTTSDINTNAVTGDKIAPNVIATGHILNNAIVTSKIADGAVTNSKIADNTITYNKLNLTDKSIPYSKVDAPTSFSANMITGKISADNLPVDYTAPRATGDKYGNDITKNYANHLELETAGGVTRLVLRPLSRQVGDQSNLGAIEPSALAKAIQDYLPKQTFDNIGGTIGWDQIDGKPPVLNMSGKIGDEMSPVYFDYSELSFKKCYDYGWLSKRILAETDSRYYSKSSSFFKIINNVGTSTQLNLPNRCFVVVKFSLSTLDTFTGTCLYDGGKKNNSQMLCQYQMGSFVKIDAYLKNNKIVYSGPTLNNITVYYYEF